jgi:hypothetical protein
LNVKCGCEFIDNSTYEELIEIVIIINVDGAHTASFKGPVRTAL